MRWPLRSITNAIVASAHNNEEEARPIAEVRRLADMNRRIALAALAVSVLANGLAFVFLTGPDWFFIPMRVGPHLPSHPAPSDTYNPPGGDEMLLGMLVNVAVWALVFGIIFALIAALSARIRRHRQAA